jgi:hypothetical protein
MEMAEVTLQDQGGGLQPVSYWARKLNPTERGNTYVCVRFRSFGRLRGRQAFEVLP